jgi:hypothetical protein
VRRLESVYLHLQQAGWRVVVKSIGTDFSGPFGMLVPREQPIELYLHRANKFSAADAQSALASALEAIGLGYSPIGAWLGEIIDEVVIPAAGDLRRAQQKATDTIIWWVVGGLAAFVLVARATAPAADAYARLAENLRRSRA